MFPVSAFSRRGFETSLRTSVFLSSARAIFAPSSCGAISRTMVSTSGSSGTLDLTPRDVAPPGFALEGDTRRGFPAGGGRERNGRAKPGNTQHPATGRAQAPVWIAKRPGMKDDHVIAKRLGGREQDRDT